MAVYIALAIIAFALLTMPVFAVVSRGRAIDPEVARRPTTVLLGYWVRDWVIWIIAPLERALIHRRVSPDALNIAGAVFGLAAGIAYAVHSPEAAGCFILAGGLADIMDGRVARARGLVSSYGEFLDSMLDRFAEVFAFVGLGAYLWHLHFGLMAVTLAAGSSLLVSYARAKGGLVGVDERGGIMQRAERLVLLALASLLDGAVTQAMDWTTGRLLLVVVWVIGIGALLTALYRTFAIARALRDEPPDGNAK